MFTKTANPDAPPRFQIAQGDPLGRQNLFATLQRRDIFPQVHQGLLLRQECRVHARRIQGPQGDPGLHRRGVRDLEAAVPSPCWLCAWVDVDPEKVPLDSLEGRVCDRPDPLLPCSSRLGELMTDILREYSIK